MLFCIAFAASDEWHQTFVPDRYGTVVDVFIDSLGVLVAGMFMLARQRSSRLTHRPGEQVSHHQFGGA